MLEGAALGEFGMQRRTVGAALAPKRIAFSQSNWRASHNDAIAATRPEHSKYMVVLVKSCLELGQRAARVGAGPVRPGAER